MTRKKQRSQSRRNKKQTNPGVFISNLLGGASKADQKSAQSTADSVKGDKNPVSDKNITRHKADESKNSLAELESVVLYKTVLELALVNIALGGGGQERGGVTGPGQYKTMAPVSSTTSAGSGGGSGLSKLMSPVQDLGKSLLGFLLGSPPPSSQQQQQPQSPAPDPQLPARRTSAVLQPSAAGTDTLPTSPGRQRPPGHPALGQSVTSTPVVVRRQNKVARSETMSRSLETASVKSSVVREESEDDTTTSTATVSASQPQPPVKKTRSQSRNSRRRKAKKAAQQKQEDSGDHDGGSRKAPLSLEDGVRSGAVSPCHGSQANTNNGGNQEPELGDSAGSGYSHSRADDGRDVDTVMQRPASDSSPAPASEDSVSQVVTRRKQSQSQQEAGEASGFVTARSSVVVTASESGAASTEGSQGHAGEATMEVPRKEELDSQDAADKEPREVAEAASGSGAGDASTQTSVAVELQPEQHSASGPPPPPPLPPPGFLLEGLKLDQLKQEEKLLPPKSCGTLRKNKQLSRKDLLINQLTEVDDSFALFLKTQLNISHDARERSGTDTLSLHTETLNRKKKERRKKTDSECSTGQEPTPTLDIGAGKSPEQQNEGSVAPVPSECDDSTVKGVDQKSSEIPSTEQKCKQKPHEIRDKRQCASNVRDRPISVIDFEQGTCNQGGPDNSTAAAPPTPASDPESVIDKTAPSASVVDTSESGDTLPPTVDSNIVSDAKPEVLEKAESPAKPRSSDPPGSGNKVEELGTGGAGAAGDMRVEPDTSAGGAAAGGSKGDTDTGGRIVDLVTYRQGDEIRTMGAAHSEFTKQNLSKSDSGYSGHDDVEDVDDDDDDTAVEHDDGKTSAAKSELTVDQALRKYDRIVEQKSAVEAAPKCRARPRTRVMSEGSEFSDDLSESDADSQAEHEDGVIRRPRENRSFNSRRSSTDSSEDGFNQNVRDLKQELKDMEEKFRKAMVANASMDNEKSQLMFQVDLLKDQVEEVEEQAALVLKELRAKTHDYELLKRDHAESVRAVQLLQAALTEQQAMLQERGLVLAGGGEEEEDGGECGEEEQERRTRAIVSQDTANILAGLGSGPLDVRIKRLAGQRDDLQDTVRRLKLDLEEERGRASMARGAADMEEAERETKKLLEDYKFRISKSDQEIATLEANNQRLESQVVRFKKASETAELNEENLKSDRRKMQRELRDSQTRNEELETQNKHLQARLDKLKTAKSNLLKEL